MKNNIIEIMKNIEYFFMESDTSIKAMGILLAICVVYFTLQFLWWCIV